MNDESGVLLLLRLRWEMPLPAWLQHQGLEQQIATNVGTASALISLPQCQSVSFVAWMGGAGASPVPCPVACLVGLVLLS